MSSNFSCSYMTMSRLTYILGFSVRFFSACLFHLEIKITSKSFAQKFELKWSLGGPLSKLCVAPPFSINFRCQIENQVSDYRLLGAFSFFWPLCCLSFFDLQLLITPLNSSKWKFKSACFIFHLTFNIIFDRNNDSGSFYMYVITVLRILHTIKEVRHLTENTWHLIMNHWYKAICLRWIGLHDFKDNLNLKYK